MYILLVINDSFLVLYQSLLILFRSIVLIPDNFDLLSPLLARLDLILLQLLALSFPFLFDMMIVGYLLLQK